MLKTNKSIYRAIMIATMVVLIVSILNQAPQVSAIASQAMIKKDVTVTLINKQLIPSDNSKTALITIEINNQSSNEIDLIDYWARINGKSTTYVTQLIEQDINKQKVLPGNTLNLSYYAYVSNNEELVDINVDMIQWDFTKSNYESVLGNLVISETNQPLVGEVVNIKYGDLNIEASLQNQFMIEDISNKIVSYRIAIKNELNKLADISALKSYAIINNSELYQAETLALGQQIDGKGQQYIYGQVIVPKEINIDAMSIALVQQKNDSILPLVVFPVDSLIPESAQKLANENTVHFGSQSYALKGKGVELATENNRVKVKIPISIQNKSGIKGDISSISFQLKTDKGLIYPLKIEETKELTLLPEIEESIVVEGFIPNEKAILNSHLLIGLKVENKDIVVKNLLIENVKVEEVGQAGEFVVDGQLITLQRLSRFPNNDLDMLVAEFDILNQSKEAKKPVKLTGKFILDGVEIDIKQTKTIQLNNSLLIQPNETERMIMYITVPFTQQINKYEVELEANEKVKQKQVMNLQGPNRILADNEKYITKTMGKKSEVSYHDSHVYSGTSDDLFVVQLQLKNIEKRNIIPSKLNGYIQTKTGEIYQLAFEAIEQALMPNGSKLLSGSTSIPRGLDTRDITIHFGEQLSSEEKIYIDPVYTVHKYDSTYRTSLSEQLTLNDKRFLVWGITKNWIKTNGVDTNGIEFIFDYQVNEVVGGIDQLGERQLLVEYQDLSLGNIKNSKPIVLNDDTLFPTGRGIFTLSYTNSTVDFLTLDDGYHINIYEVYKGYKRQLSGQFFSY